MMGFVCEFIAEIAADILAALLAERTAADEAHVSKRIKLDASNLLERMIGEQKCHLNNRSRFSI